MSEMMEEQIKHWTDPDSAAQALQGNGTSDDLTDRAERRSSEATIESSSPLTTWRRLNSVTKMPHSSISDGLAVDWPVKVITRSIRRKVGLTICDQALSKSCAQRVASRYCGDARRPDW